MSVEYPPLEQLVFEGLSRNHSTHIVLLLWQHLYYDADRGAHRTFAELAESLGVTERHIKRAARALRDLGLLEYRASGPRTLATRPDDPEHSALLLGLQTGKTIVDLQNGDVIHG